MKHILFILCLTILSSSLNAQKRVIDRNVELERLTKTESDFLKNYLNWGYNLNIENPEGLETKWSSVSIGYGSFIKMRAAKFYTFGLGIGAEFNNFKIEQNEENLLGNGVIHESQNLHIYTAKLALRNRFHLGRHGLKDGLFVDLGIDGSIKFANRFRVVDELDPALPGNAGSKESETVYRKLKFTELLGYYGIFAIGRNDFSVFGQYRFSNLFKAHEGINNGVVLPQIAPLVVGIRLELAANS